MDTHIVKCIADLEPGQQPSFRRATEMDVEALAHIWVITQYAVYGEGDNIFDLTATRTYISTVLLPLHKVWVSVISGQVIGFIALYEERIVQLHVSPDWQRRKIGTQMLELAKAESQGRLVLSCYPAKVGAFYRGCGFYPSADLGESSENKYAEYTWSADFILH